MIEITNLSKYINDNTIVKDVNLSINDGTKLGIVGKSGAGKSSLVRMINYLMRPSEGKVIVDGQDLSKLKNKELQIIRKDIGMVFQQFNLLQQKNVYNNIKLSLDVVGYDSDKKEDRINELLKLVGLTSKRNDYPKTLSGGEQQRVAIARALALNSKVLLSDEATSALDPKTTESILKLLVEINEKLGITIVVVAHQMEVIKGICDKVAVLDRGEVALEGRVEDVFLNEQTKLNHILGGGDEILLPKTGVNIRIISSEKDRSKKIISRIAKDLGISYSVPWSNIEQFKNNLYAVIYINIDEKDIEQVSKYLNDKEMNWRVVEDE